MTRQTEVKVIREYIDENGKRRRVVEESMVEYKPGKMSPHTLVLSPEDCRRSVGDDDGDVYAVSTSPDLVELFTHKLDQLKLGIEPEGIERKDSKGNPLQSDSDEGFAYLVEDHRGPVGWCTVQRSRLLAVGDELGARAMSIWIQECVDKAKRLPKWSKAMLATDMNNWVTENGVLKFNHKFSDEETPGGEFPMDLIRSWVNGRIIAAGCTQIAYNSAGKEITKAGDPLWWRAPGKRIDVDQWNLPEKESKYENLVHYAARCTHQRWEEFKQVFAIPETGEVGMGALLPLVMRAKGIDARVVPQTERSYTQLKAKSGLSAYNAKLYTILGSKSEDHVDVEDLTDLEAKERQRAINTAQADLEETIINKFTSGELTVNEILTLWVHECSPTGKTNSAFRLVCFENSPVLDMLGIAEATKCKFLGKGNRADRIITQSLESADPFEAMKNIILASRVHALGHAPTGEKPYLDELGKPMELHECVDCMTTIQDGLVRTLRTRKDSREKAYLTDLRQRMTDILEGHKKEVSKAEMLAWEGTFLKGET